MIASFLKFSGLFSLFWTISAMVFICPVVSKSSNPSFNLLVNVLRAPITIDITVTFMYHSFSVLKQDPGIYRFFCFLSIFLCGQAEWQNPQFGWFLFCCSLSQGLVIWPRLSNPFVSQNPNDFCAFHFLGRILACSSTSTNSSCISNCNSSNSSSCIYQFTLLSLLSSYFIFTISRSFTLLSI